MTDSTTIREALERNARAVQLKPSVGQGTAVTKIRLQPGLRCDVEEGAWKFTVGMSEKYGGQRSPIRACTGEVLWVVPRDRLRAVGRPARRADRRARGGGPG